MSGGVYEVNLDVDVEVTDAYRAWLDDHAAQMLTLPSFTSARMSEVAEPAT